VEPCNICSTAKLSSWRLQRYRVVRRYCSIHSYARYQLEAGGRSDTPATGIILTLSLPMSYIYGAPCKVRNFYVVHIWTYVRQR
jgi:hypothetical protein